MKKNLFFTIIFNCGLLAANAQTISTIAGDSIRGYSGDGGPATSAELNTTNGITVDNKGNIFFSDAINNRIRRIDKSGIITTVAGIGVVGYSGDGGLATAAELNVPGGLAIDRSGNIFFADTYNQRIRMIDTLGIITTVAGNGTSGYLGDGGPATLAEFTAPLGLALDSTGNIYIADCFNYRIRKIDISGNISTVAGNGIAGYTGDSMQATSTEINHPWGVTIDRAGNIFIADWYNNRIRKVNPAGIITTVAGTGGFGSSGDSGLATLATLSRPTGVRVDLSGNIFIADWGYNVIRKVNPAGIIYTIAGNKTAGYTGDGGPATSAELNSPLDISLDNTDNIYISDQNNNRIRKITYLGAGINNIIENKNLEIYPNPSAGIFFISTHYTGKPYVKVFDVMGNVILDNQCPSGGSIKIDISGAPDGVYIVVVKTTDMTYSQKIIKAQ